MLIDEARLLRFLDAVEHQLTEADDYAAHRHKGYSDYPFEIDSRVFEELSAIRAEIERPKFPVKPLPQVRRALNLDDRSVLEDWQEGP